MLESDAAYPLGYPVVDINKHFHIAKFNGFYTYETISISARIILKVFSFRLRSIEYIFFFFHV